MLKIKNIQADIPGGWRIRVKETGHTLTADTFAQLVDLVKHHLRINTLDVPPNISDTIEHAIANRLPSHRVKEMS